MQNNRRRRACLPCCGCVAIFLVTAAVLCFWPLGPRLPGGLEVQRRIAHIESWRPRWSPVDDGWDYSVYQLRKFDVATWVKEQDRRGAKWVRGPIAGTKHAEVLSFLASFSELSESGIDRHFPIDKWVHSDKVYFKISDIIEDRDYGIEAAGMWVLDSRNCRLFYLCLRT